MNRDKPHILWLDYDGPIDHDCLVDIEIAASRLSAGSGFLRNLTIRKSAKLESNTPCIIQRLGISTTY